MAFHTLQQLAAHDQNSASTAPNRPVRYLSGGAGLLPHSCTLYVYKDLADALSFTARSLKTGSGVKAVFDKDFVISKPETNAGQLTMCCLFTHPDYSANVFASPSTELAYDYLLVVQDSMETEQGLAGECGIIDAWSKTIALLQQGKNVAVDLSNLRPAGSRKHDGYNVTSSGPASFAQIFIAIGKYAQNPCMQTLLELLGTANAVILKGGHKKGIVTSAMHCECKHFGEYLDVPTAGLDGSHKKGVIVTKAFAKQKKYAKLRAKVYNAVNTESIFLQKDSAELPGNYANTYANVCVGIMLPDRGTCLIWRVNLGLVKTRQELIDAFVLATEQCVSLHKIWHDNQPKHTRGLWQPIENDCQIAIDPMGLANMLSLHGITYKQFMNELDVMLNGKAGLESNDTLAEWFAAAYMASTKAAQELAAELGLPPFLRLHTVEPAQSHAFRAEDSEGYTVCRGIWPPFDSIVNRVSDVEDIVTVDHGEVETIADVTPAEVFRLNDLWQQLMNRYGLPHAISMDAYEYLDEDKFQRWYDSNLLTQYYMFAGAWDQSYARKTVEAIEVKAERKLAEDDDDAWLKGFGQAATSGPRDTATGKVCMIDPTQPAGECSVCAE